MALLGFHLVLTLISLSVLQKFSARYSIGRWLLAQGLTRYLHPSTESLRKAAGLTGDKNKARRRKRDKDEKDDFLLPKSTEFDLYCVPVRAVDVLPLPFYVEFRWLVDFTFAALIVYALSEFHSYLIHGVETSEVNLSIIWCTVVICFCFKSLTSMCALYFRQSTDGGAAGSGADKNDATSYGERSMVLSVGVAYFLLSMILLLGMERFFDLHLTESYANFSSAANEYLRAQDVSITRSRGSSVLLYFFFSIYFAFLAGMLVFPAFRFARMHVDGVNDAESPLKKVLLQVGFFAPLAAVAFWLRPLSYRILTRDPPVITSSQLDSVRLWLVVLASLMRFCLARTYLQAYLDGARKRVEAMRKESGRINSAELQKMKNPNSQIARVFMYVCVAALQLLVPIVLILMLACLLKTLGAYAWLEAFPAPAFLQTMPFPPVRAILAQWSAGSVASANATTAAYAKTDMAASLAQLSHLFSAYVNRGLFSFGLVMTMLVQVSLEVMGLIYCTQFVPQ